MKRFDQINMIPFIDIMLVLLAIVLTTASFVSNGLIEVSLPDVSQPILSQQQVSIELAVDGNNQWYAQGEPIGRVELGSFITDYGTDTHIKLRIDAAADFEAFLSLVDSLKTKGYKKLSVQVKKR